MEDYKIIAIQRGILELIQIELNEPFELPCKVTPLNVKSVIKDLDFHNLYILDNQLPSSNDYKIQIDSSCCHISIINCSADNNS